MIIAIDGPAAAGKGTLARRLAAHLNYAYLDTGSLYRAVGLQMIRSGHSVDDADAAIKAAADLGRDLLDDPDLRSEETGKAASCVAAIPDVRRHLLAFQRNFAQTPPGGLTGVVIDGRDIGTIVCPDADLKFFVTASAEVRADRRVDELKGRGEAVEREKILADIETRDLRDRSRETAPLRQAEDAHLLDTTNLDIDGVFSKALAIIEKTVGAKE